MRLHEDSFDISVALVRELLTSHAPAGWGTRPLRHAGSGTDNVMMRLGDDLVVRLPQRRETSVSIEKEIKWLPHLRDILPVEVPLPVFVAGPSLPYPSSWAVYEWIDGEEPRAESVTDWARFGRDLAGFVRALHAADTTHTTPGASLRWYRGRPLSQFVDDGMNVIDEVAALVDTQGLDLDVPRLRQVWHEVSTTPQDDRSEVLLHGDLRAAKLLVRDGRLSAVIDFGTLSIGLPQAEHGPIWGFPVEAREAYRRALDLAPDDWLVGLGWALLPSLTGLPYYWRTWPEFAHGCLDRIQLVLEEAAHM